MKMLTAPAPPRSTGSAAVPRPRRSMRGLAYVLVGVALLATDWSHVWHWFATPSDWLVVATLAGIGWVCFGAGFVARAIDQEREITRRVKARLDWVARVEAIRPGYRRSRR